MPRLLLALAAREVQPPRTSLPVLVSDAVDAAEAATLATPKAKEETTDSKLAMHTKHSARRGLGQGIVLGGVACFCV